MRTATTTDYTHATYLQHALGLPASNTNPVIESVTYDRFQWLLQQPGNFAVLIGDPATDPSFAARAQDVEAAAKTAGVKKVYWFNPNLSGSAKVGTVHRARPRHPQPGGITSLAAASQTKYGNAWLNLVGQYLGNGVTVDRRPTPAPTRTRPSRDRTRRRPTVNDVGTPGALYDYSSGAAPANVAGQLLLHLQQGQPRSARTSRRRSSPGST